MRKPIENCPQPETPIRERAWTAEQQAVREYPAEELESHCGKLWDSQWTNVVNHDNCYAGWDKDDAINHAVKLTEQYIRKNFDTYAATLRKQPTNPPEIGSKLVGQQAERAGGVVSDVTVERACLAYIDADLHLLAGAVEWMRDPMRSALEAVAPLLCAPAESPCSLSEALNVIEQWGVDGNTLEGDDVGRFRALTDKIAPAEQGGRVDFNGWWTKMMRVWFDFGPHEERYTEDDRDLAEQAWNAALAQPNTLGDFVRLPDAERVAIGQHVVDRAIAMQIAQGDVFAQAAAASPQQFQVKHAERARVPAGMVLVPREPTVDMLAAMAESYWGEAWNEPGMGDDRLIDARNMYDDALAAAPSQPDDAA